MAFPHVCVASVLVTGLDRLVETSAEAWEATLASLRQTITADSIAQVPAIAAWREAYRLQGLKPSQWRSSVEALLRRALSGGDPRIGLPAVDLYNLFSMKFMVPMGGYDLDRLPSGRIALRLLRAEDRFDPLGKVERPKDSARVIVYADGDDVLCFGFNHRDSKQTAISSQTTRALFFCEAVTLEQRASLAPALTALAEQLRRCGVEVGPIAMADTQTSKATLREPG